MTVDQRRRTFQAALGLTADGIIGPKTMAAAKAGIDTGTVVALSRPSAPADPAIIIPRRGIVRLIIHWTAGGPTASALDKRHYHSLTEADGTLVMGDTPEDENISTTDGIYAAHTLMLNTGSLSHAMCGMLGAKERPFSSGPSPLTERQVTAACRNVAAMCRRWNVLIARETCLTHAEVQPTLKVRQTGKWDITWLPGMDRPGDPVEVGDRLRAMIRSF